MPTWLRDNVTAQVAGWIVCALLGSAATFFWTRILNVGASLVPPGAVVAFNLTDCPHPGWTRVKEAEGKFIVGVDGQKFGLSLPGGMSSVPLTPDNIPAFTMSVRVGGVKGGSEGPVVIPDNNPGARSAELAPLTVGVGGKGPTPVNILPPYLPFLYCQKS